MKLFAFLALFALPCLSVAAHQSPYAGEEIRPIKSLSDREIGSLRRGEGMGFAKLAELNHFPGPKHVLELADGLELTASQRAQTETLYEKMQRAAVDLGEQILAAESRLDQEFEKRSISPDTLSTALLEIGELRARLRYVHLEAHLHQKIILRPEQVREYDKLRGYRDGKHEH